MMTSKGAVAASLSAVGGSGTGGGGVYLCQRYLTFQSESATDSSVNNLCNDDFDIPIKSAKSVGGNERISYDDKLIPDAVCVKIESDIAVYQYSGDTREPHYYIKVETVAVNETEGRGIVARSSFYFGQHPENPHVHKFEITHNVLYVRKDTGNDEWKFEKGYSMTTFKSHLRSMVEIIWNKNKERSIWASCVNINCLKDEEKNNLSWKAVWYLRPSQKSFRNPFKIMSTEGDVSFIGRNWKDDDKFNIRSIYDDQPKVVDKVVNPIDLTDDESEGEGLWIECVKNSNPICSKELKLGDAKFVHPNRHHFDVTG